MGLTQEKFAAKLGVTYPTINRWENGRAKPSPLAMKQIEELSKLPEKNFNQIVRWVLNKENHADELAHIVTHYFLTQRIKVVDTEDTKAHQTYLTKITLCHEMLVYAMKVKQTTDLAHTEKLRRLLKAFFKEYFSKEAAKHTH